MTDLAAFLLERIADDEVAARRAAFGYGLGWTNETDDAEDWSVVHADGKRDMVGCEDSDVTQHIALHDPARVLADCEARRWIVQEAVAYLAGEEQGGWAGVGSREHHHAEQTLQWLALPYADHPDYREEWAP